MPDQLKAPAGGAAAAMLTEAPVWFSIVNVRLLEPPTDTEPKLSSVGLNVRLTGGFGSGSGCGNPPSPLPSRLTKCGLPGALLFTRKVPRSIALLVGLNVISKVVAAPLASVPLNAAHEKSAPVDAGKDRFSTIPAVFLARTLRVFDCPTATAPKVRAMGVSCRPGNPSTFVDSTQVPESPSSRRTLLNGVGRTLRPNDTFGCGSVRS